MLSACASITSMQSARTLKKEQEAFAVGVGFTNLHLDVGAEERVSTPVIAVDVMGRYGITDDDEIGLRVTNIFSFAVADYKRALVRDGSVIVSAGAGIGGTSYSTSDERFLLIDFYLPLYVDIPLSDDVSLVFAPKYILRGRWKETSEFSNQLASSGGIRIGKEQGVMAEAAYASVLEDSSQNYWDWRLSFFF